jgi:DNA-binding MarR family transcriptional regulator
VGRLQQEIKQSRPFASRQQEAFLSILKTADILRRNAAALLAPFRLSLEQYNVLRILRGAGDAGLPTLEVASRLIEQSPAITRLMDKLEAKQLIRRRRCPQDRRQVLCWITPTGLDRLELVAARFDPAAVDGLKQLRERDVTQLIVLLDAVREGADKTEER